MDNVMELKKETIISVSEYTGKLVEGIYQVVDYFQKGREDIATRMCGELIEGLEWLVEAVSLTKDVLDRMNAEIDINDINGILNELVGAFENRDYVLVGDLLEYELCPVVNSWNIKIGEMVKGREFNDLV